MKATLVATQQLSALQLDGNVSDYLVDLGHFLGQESHDFPGLIIWNIAVYSKPQNHGHFGLWLYLLYEIVAKFMQSR